VSAVSQIRAVAGAVPDPEIPILTLDDLGIVRDVQVEGQRVMVEIAPTYSGCPAVDPIRREVEQAIRLRGYSEVEVRTVLSPAWSTDWISEEGRRKLRAYGVAPPAAHAATCPIADARPRCPRCGSDEAREISRFGATPCQAHYVCDACAEPFNYFKTLR
jgi:ring-1,2-phenylacetyl-CoA epoxidase subunit PaaD